jgi:AcrR family transcriptional regulator
MQNGIPDAQRVPGAAASAAERALSRRRAVYADEVRRLVAASFALIRDTGQLEPRVSEVVRAAGLSNQAFYRHFRSKDELLLAVLADGLRQLAGYLGRRMDAASAPLEKVRRFLAGVCEQALHPRAATATRPFARSRGRLAERFPAEVEETERQLTHLLRGAIEEAVAVGALPAADPERDADLLYHLAMGWVERQLARTTRARRRDAEHLVAFALAGLRRGGASGPA